VKRFPVVSSAKANAEVLAAVTWWAEHRSAEQAKRWLRGILRAIEGLSANPTQHPVAAESDNLPFEVRELFFGLGRRPSHRVLFRIRADCILILSVRHVSQEPLGPDDLP
jgi:plasmid stabilization system protein ParE